VKNKVFHFLLIVLLLSGCAPQAAEPSFDDMKKMMSDALQTEDGKKAIKQMFTDPEFRELVVLEHPEIKKSIEETMLSKKGEEFWKKTFEDPKFLEKMAKSMKQQQQDVMKQLMTDASFQKEMEDFFGQPDMQKQLEKVIQSSNMKKQYEKAIEETINSPLLQTKWQELIKAAGEPTESGGGGGGPESKSGPGGSGGSGGSGGGKSGGG
jgi:spore germination protein D